MAKSIHLAPFLALLLAGLAADVAAQDPSPTAERRAAPCAPRTSRAAPPCEPTTLAFIHAWRRGDDQPMSVKADYPIGANVDLVSVRSRQLRCTCADAPDGAAAPEPRP